MNKNMNKKKELIIESAKIEFEIKGYHDAKISDIAKGADIRTSTVYEYFQSKQSLFEEMISCFITDYFQRATTLIEKETDVIKKLKILLELDWEMEVNYGKIKNVVLSKIFYNGDSLKFKFMMAREEKLKMIGLIFDEGIKDGIFIKQDSRILSMVFKGGFSQVFLDRILKIEMNLETEKKENFGEIAEKAFQMFINSIKS